MPFRFVLFLLFVSLTVLGCGYQLRLVNVVEEEEHQLERRNDMVDSVIGIRSDLRGVQEKLASFDQTTQSLKKRMQQDEQLVKDLRKRGASLNARFDELGLSLRLIQGGLEKRDHKFDDLSRFVDGQKFRIEEIEVNEQELVKEMDGIKEGLATLGTKRSRSFVDQERKVKDLAVEVEELSTNVPPLLADQAEYLKALSKNLESYSDQGTGEVEQLSKSLVSLSDALDLLGQKISTKVDQQDKLMRKLSKRLESVEAKLEEAKP